MTPTILLVDDDPAVLDALRFCLWSDGFQVRTYRDGIDLLDDPILPRADCLVISDSLRETDALALIEQLHRLPINVPIICLSARATPSMRRRAAALGVRCVLEKPLVDDGLAQAMVSVLGQRSRAEAPAVRRNP